MVKNKQEKSCNTSFCFGVTIAKLYWNVQKNKPVQFHTLFISRGCAPLNSKMEEEKNIQKQLILLKWLFISVCTVC